MILPSDFSGGTTRLSCGGIVKEVDGSSFHSTTVIAWYNAVSCEVTTVTHGTRVALVYNLMHTNNIAPLISSPNLEENVNAALTSWGKSLYEGPKLIIHLINKIYPDEVIKADLLTGIDLLQVQALAPIAQRHGFRLALGTLRHRAIGRSTHMDPSTQDHQDATRMTDVVSLFGLDGRLLLDKLTLTGSDFFEDEILVELENRVARRPCDEMRCRDVSHLTSWIEQTEIHNWRPKAEYEQCK